MADSTGAVLTDAEVTATNVETKAARTGPTNGAGRFLFSQVNPGSYVVTVTASGWAEQRSRPVEVDLGRTVTLNFTMSPASAT